MADDEYERSLCQLPQCHVFKIPVRSSAAGHRASDWPTDPQWTGKVKIVAKGKTAAIFLMNADDNRVFACCPVTDDAAVERCVDSGRYFVLRITNPQGKHAFIGIAFNERNDAFDFNVALSEHKASVERSEAPIQVAASLGDLSIGEGEKIKLKNISGAVSPKKKPMGGGGAFTLAPPPRDSHIKKGAKYGGGAPEAAQGRPGKAGGGGGGGGGATADLLGGGDDLLSMPAPAPPAPMGDFAASANSGGGDSLLSMTAPAPAAAPQVAAVGALSSGGFDSFSPSGTGAPAAPAAPAAAPVGDDPFAGFSSPSAPAPAPAPAPVDPLAAAFASPPVSGGTPSSVGQGFSPMPAPATPDDPFAAFGGAPAMGGGMSAQAAAAAAPQTNVFDSFGSPAPAPAPKQQGGSLLDF